MQDRRIDSVAFVGGGNMGLALAKAIASRFPRTQLWVCDLRPERVERFLRELPGSRPAAGPAAAAEAAKVLFLAVKPQDVTPLLAELGAADCLVLSIAAGVRLAVLEEAMPQARVVRVMPNTPSLVGAMAAGYACGRRAGPADRQAVAELLAAAGYAAELEEGLLDAVTGVSGSGPAFVACLVEAFIEAGVRLGIPAEIARRLSLETFAGTARLLEETGIEPQELVEMVSSPEGTTAAGLQVLEGSDCRRALVATIEATARRSKELGE